MDQVKIGAFLKELRTEKGLTQLQLAEQLNTTNRSVSRWETGSTLPDISILVELASLYDVDIKEIIDGERKGENMDGKLKESLLVVADYSKKTNLKITKKIVIGLLITFAIILTAVVMIFSSKIKELTPDSYPVYPEVVIDSSVTNELLTNYIITKMGNTEDGEKNFVSIVVYSSEEKSKNKYYVYTLINESKYSFDNGILTEESGSIYPCRFELKRDNMEYVIVDSEVPRDGSYYNEDINKAFPEYVRERIYNHNDSAYKDVEDNNLIQAKEYFGIK